MTGRENAIIRTIETKLALAESSEQHEIWITLDVMHEILDLLKEQESLKHKMWNALYAEEEKLENHYVSTDEFDKWIVDYRPFLQRGFEIAIEVIAAHEEGR